jgi:hypothetical protein
MKQTQLHTCLSATPWITQGDDRFHAFLTLKPNTSVVNFALSNRYRGARTRPRRAKSWPGQTASDLLYQVSLERILFLWKRACTVTHVVTPCAFQPACLSSAWRFVLWLQERSPVCTELFRKVLRAVQPTGRTHRFLNAWGTRELTEPWMRTSGRGYSCPVQCSAANQKISLLRYAGNRLQRAVPAAGLQGHRIRAHTGQGSHTQLNEHSSKKHPKEGGMQQKSSAAFVENLMCSEYNNTENWNHFVYNWWDTQIWWGTRNVHKIFAKNLLTVTTCKKEEQMGGYNKDGTWGRVCDDRNWIELGMKLSITLLVLYLFIYSKVFVYLFTYSIHFCGFYYSPNIIRVIKSIRMISEEHVARKEEMRKAYWYFVWKAQVQSPTRTSRTRWEKKCYRRSYGHGVWRLLHHILQL